MLSFLRLFHRVIIKDTLHNRLRTLLTLTGVALGIAVVVGVHLANERAVDSFNDSLAIMNGQADLQISANGLDLDETLIGELAWVWDVGVMAAIVEGRLDVNIPQNQSNRSPFDRHSVRLFCYHRTPRKTAPLRRRPCAWAPNLRIPRTCARFRTVLACRGGPKRAL